MTSSKSKRTKVFISYSHKDAKYLDGLLPHLKYLERNKLIDLWTDTNIKPGERWQDEIQLALASAKVAILLISIDFLNSQFIVDNELPPLLAAAKAEGVKILPVVLRPCTLPKSLSQFQALNSLSRPLAKMKGYEREELWVKTVNAIMDALNSQTLLDTSLVEQISTTGRTTAIKRDSEAVQSNFLDKAPIGDFDVFLYPDDGDRPRIKEIGRMLKERGILPWLDEWESPPGQPWQHLLEKQMERIKSAAFFVGKRGMGPYWQQVELESILREFINRGCPVIPVLLLDALKQPELPVFLKGMTWIDFRIQTPDPIEMLILGITQGLSERPSPQMTETEQGLAIQLSNSNVHIFPQTGMIEVVDDLQTMPLTAQQVISAWDNVRIRTKQKSKSGSGMLAAYLGHYQVVGIEGGPEHPVVVIRAGKSVHYQYVRDENRYKDLEWALEMEFGLPCQVRLLPPDQPPSLAPVSDAASYSTGAALAPISKEDNKISGLTVQMVVDSWENVRKRTKQTQKSGSGMLAAYLGHFKIIGIEGTPVQPVVVIQAEKSAHYQYVKEENRCKDLEWALEMEFGLPCKVRLHAPEMQLSKLDF